MTSLSINDRVIVSRQDGCGWAVAIGNIKMVKDKSVTLLLDKLA